MGVFGRFLTQLADAAAKSDAEGRNAVATPAEVGPVDAGHPGDGCAAAVPEPGYGVSWDMLPVNRTRYTVGADAGWFYGDRDAVDAVYGIIYGLEALVNGIGLPRRFATPVNALRAVPCGEEPPSRTGTVQFRFAPPTKAGEAPRNALRVDVLALEPGTAHEDGAIWHIDFTATGKVAKADAHYWEGGACHSFRLRSKGTPLRVEWAGIILPSGKSKTLYEPEVG